MVVAKLAVLPSKLMSGKFACSRIAVFNNTIQRIEILTLSPSGNFRYFIYVLAKLGHALVPVVFIRAGKVTFYRPCPKILDN